MQKDFEGWMRVKKRLHEEKKRAFFHEREVWFCSVGTNVGFEQDGRGEKFLRPAVVFRKFNNEVCWVIPLTKNQKEGKYYFQFSFEDGVVSTAILSQIRLIDVKRLEYKIGDMKKEDFRELQSRIRGLVG